MNTFYLEKNVLFGKRPIYFKDEWNGGGIVWINYMENYSWPKVNSLMEMCCGPGFMGYFLKHKYNIPKLILVDIYEPLKEGIDRTNRENNWEDEVKFYLSDCFQNYGGESVDMIVANPPHFFNMDSFILENPNLKKNQTRYVSDRIFLDENLHFHKNFLNDLDNFLNKDGYLMLYENKNYIPPELILELKPNLKLIDYIPHPQKPTYSGLFQII